MDAPQIAGAISNIRLELTELTRLLPAKPDDMETAKLTAANLVEKLANLEYEFVRFVAELGSE